MKKQFNTNLFDYLHNNISYSPCPGFTIYRDSQNRVIMLHLDYYNKAIAKALDRLKWHFDDFCYSKPLNIYTIFNLMVLVPEITAIMTGSFSEFDPSKLKIRFKRAAELFPEGGKKSESEPEPESEPESEPEP